MPGPPSLAPPVTDARIQHRIEQIDHQVGDDVERGEHHHHALNEGEVVAGYALNEELSQTVEVEYLLGDDEAAEQERELETDDGDRRQQRVAQRVAANHHGFGDALGARRGDI